MNDKAISCLNGHWHSTSKINLRESEETASKTVSQIKVSNVILNPKWLLVVDCESNIYTTICSLKKKQTTRVSNDRSMYPSNSQYLVTNDKVKTTESDSSNLHLKMEDNNSRAIRCLNNHWHLTSESNIIRAEKTAAKNVRSVKVTDVLEPTKLLVVDCETNIYTTLCSCKNVQIQKVTAIVPCDSTYAGYKFTGVSNNQEATVEDKKPLPMCILPNDQFRLTICTRALRIPTMPRPFSIQIPVYGKENPFALTEFSSDRDLYEIMHVRRVPAYVVVWHNRHLPYSICSYNLVPEAQRRRIQTNKSYVRLSKHASLDICLDGRFFDNVPFRIEMLLENTIIIGMDHIRKYFWNREKYSVHITHPISRGAFESV